MFFHGQPKRPLRDATGGSLYWKKGAPVAASKRRYNGPVIIGENNASLGPRPDA